MHRITIHLGGGGRLPFSVVVRAFCRNSTILCYYSLVLSLPPSLPPSSLALSLPLCFLSVSSAFTTKLLSFPASIILHSFLSNIRLDLTNAIPTSVSHFVQCLSYRVTLSCPVQCQSIANFRLISTRVHNLYISPCIFDSQIYSF